MARKLRRAELCEIARANIVVDGCDTNIQLLPPESSAVSSANGARQPICRQLNVWVVFDLTGRHTDVFSGEVCFVSVGVRAPVRGVAEGSLVCVHDGRAGECCNRRV
jgi:hypothetical protein